ncbi:hypothetical protein Dsin_031869 [Dipteronia sinensis]|uniref:Exostosin GT47 domain-containing protein n=1 Tax=Dipteronia sinensis TaxID=43782 RepID=A0AAD9ZM03_9ROSI|nr:hypothetical protein Dsin_031869 [Dipteronia sinensis]
MKQYFNRKNDNTILFSLVSASLAIVCFVAVFKDSKGFSSFSLSAAGPASSPWRPWTTRNLETTPGEIRKQKQLINLENKKQKQKDEKLEKVEAGLERARALIREAVLNPNYSSSSSSEDKDYVPHGDIYRNAHAFHWSYLLMEKLFKIFVYEEGEPPLFHYALCKNIYSMEGFFLSFIETKTKFRIRNPEEAHVYFLPFSVVMIIEHLFDPIIRDKAVLQHTVSDYVRIISHKYRYWNRSLGTDHFMLSCHDWGPLATWYVPELYNNSIRALCNANTSEHFNPKKDAPIPEINLVTGEIKSLTGGLPPSRRTILAFFAGRLHGEIRPVLLQHWKEKDKDVQVYENLPQELSYQEMLKKSKFCICPSGYEVASPRIVEAIYAECVPVLISQHYVLPFSDVLDWDSFSIQVPVSEIPNLKKILMGIPEDQYVRMYERVKMVQRHFVVNNPPLRYDVFHMILHSIWLRRLNELKQAPQVDKVVRRYSKLEKLEAGLARARSSIREAALIRNSTSTHRDSDYVPRGSIYTNANAFHRSYLEMEKLFKIYVYEEGELPLFHDGPCKNIYSSEGSLFRDLEFYNIYRTKDSDEALVFFLPFSVVKLVEYLYVPGDYRIPGIGRAVVDYINTVSTKYPFWNRSLGADHFMLACHDWGPRTSKFVPNLFNKSIRVLCNANTSEGFNPGKDVTLPGLYLTEKLGGLLGGLSPSHRSILAFFAGGEHGHIRSVLFQHWKNSTDRDIQVHKYLPAGVSYNSMMQKSKFCLCPSGYEVGSPRIVEAIYAGCVPVIIKDGYVPPFSDVLNWKTFSVKVEVKEIPNLKNILMNISQRQYLRMQRRVKQVQRHFLVNETPKRFDIFHMTVHSIWLRRLNVQIKDFDDQS